MTASAISGVTAILDASRREKQARYDQAVSTLASGKPIDQESIATDMEAIGKTADDMANDVAAASRLLAAKAAVAKQISVRGEAQRIEKEIDRANLEYQQTVDAARLKAYATIGPMNQRQTELCAIDYAGNSARNYLAKHCRDLGAILAYEQLVDRRRVLSERLLALTAGDATVHPVGQYFANDLPELLQKRDDKIRAELVDVRRELEQLDRETQAAHDRMVAL